MDEASDILLPNRFGRQELSCQKPFNEILEFLKFLKNFGLMLEQVDLCEFAKIINEAHIIFIPSNELTSHPKHLSR
jgi:hypothetical protein